MNRNPWISSLKRIFAQPAFVVIVAILFLAAAGLNGATSYMKLSFKKVAVPLSRPLADVPDKLGPWVQVSLDETLGHEMQEALATDKYVFRSYVDSRVVSKADLDKFQGKSSRECNELLAAIQAKRPEAVINLALTYYTGLVDTVAHIPDRCYIADGFEPTIYDVVTWNSIKDRQGDQKLRFIVFEDSTPGRSHDKQSLKYNIAYFFHCNGSYVNDPIGVRKRLAHLFEKYGYYMKIEIKTCNIPTADAARVMDDFLSNLLPESEKCLPDWAAMHPAR